MYPDVEFEARTAGVLADQPGFARLLHRRLQALGLVMELAADVDVGEVRVHGQGSQQTPFK